MNLSQATTSELVDELASRTKLGRIDVSQTQDAGITYGRKGSSTVRIERVSGPATILVVRE